MTKLPWCFVVFEGADAVGKATLRGVYAGLLRKRTCGFGEFVSLGGLPVLLLKWSFARRIGRNMALIIETTANPTPVDKRTSLYSLLFCDNPS